MNNLSPRALAERKYNNSRFNLMIMLAFTLVNIILLYTKLDLFMLFSASIPYYAMAFALWDETGVLLIPGLVIAANAIIAYLLCWLLSKKYRAWMLVALILFSFDTLALIGLYVLAKDFSGIVDLLIHVWVFYYLIVGVINARKLKTLPLEETEGELVEIIVEKEPQEPRGPEL